MLNRNSKGYVIFNFISWSSCWNWILVGVDVNFWEVKFGFEFGV